MSQSVPSPRPLDPEDRGRAPLAKPPDGPALIGRVSVRTLLAVIIWAMSAVLACLGIALLAATWSTDVPGVWGVRGFAIALGLASASIGVVVVVRVSGNPIGWLFMTSGLLGALQGFCVQYAVAGLLAAPGSLPGPELAAWVGGWAWIPAMSAMGAFLPLVFPSGSLPSPRWRPVVAFGVVCASLATLGAMLLPGRLDNSAYLDNPYAVVTGFPGQARWMAYLPLIVAILVGGVTLAVTFRRSTGERRQQLKWLAFSAALAAAALALEPIGQAGIGVLPGWASRVTEVLVVLGLLGIPVSAGVAVLRYRLWEIDRIVSRTISYLIVSAVLAALFAATVVGLQELLSPVTGQGTVAVAAATLLAFTVFQPLRRRVQVTVDRRFNRARVDTQRVLDGFAAGLRDDTELDSLNDHLETVVARSMQPRSVAVWTRRVGAAR